VCCLLVLNLVSSADAVYGPGFKDLNEVQKYYVYNAPYTAAVTGEDVADIIEKLRSEYQKGHAAAAGAEHASDDEGSDDDILAAATNLNDIRRSLLRETADFVAKFKDG